LKTVIALAWFSLASTQVAPQAYQSWSAKQAESIGKSMRVDGRVGGWFDGRIVRTNESYNYKLAATWITPDVIRATARLRQLSLRLSPAETDAFVETALRPDTTTVLVEIDPREGSGVIPLDWLAILETGGTVIRGTAQPALRDDPAFAGVARRNYDYERFWMTFPLHTNGTPSFPSGAASVDLVVRIKSKEGRVSWPVTGALREWLAR
jgi:hypothetical protein